MAGNTFYGRAMAVRAAIAAAMCAAMAPSNAHARSLLYYYDFDKIENNTLVYQGVNKGSGMVEFTFKQNGAATPGYVTSGAFGSGGAFCASTGSSLWLGSDATPLGCNTTVGFTMSFWLKTSASHNAWTDFFGFRVAGYDYRCEYTTGNTGNFTMYHSSGTNPVLPLEEGGPTTFTQATAGTWKHVAFVFTPNSTNNFGTCSIYIGGEHVGNMKVVNPGSLQQIHVGSWVRVGNGDRKTSATSTCIDELAVFDYPATAEQVKWLAKFKPGQPAKGPGREMPLAYLLDTVSNVSGVGLLADNSGTGTDAAYKWQAGYANWPTSGGGAFGSAYAFHINNNVSFRVDGASATDGLGAGLDSGMTLSFWIKAPASTSLWRDFMSFRIGNSRYERFEWCAGNPMRFTIYGAVSAGGQMTPLDTDTWQNVCMTWNSAESKMEFYLDGVKTGMTLALNGPTDADVLKSFTIGCKVFNDTGGARTQGGSSANVFLDEVAIFNHSFSPAQIQWLTNNVPCLPPLDSTNLVRTVSEDGVWFGKKAVWGVREWDAENEAWAASARTTIYPALEDTEVEAEVTIADGVELTNDTFVTPKKLVLKVADGAASATLKSAEGSMFAPQALEIVGGLQLAVPLYAVNMGGALTLGAGSKIVFDTANYGDVGGRGATALPVTNAMSVGSFVLPEGESDVLSHFGVTDSRFTLSLSADGKTILVAADTIPVVATWTGAGDGTSLGSAANWDCRNAAGAKVDDALPCANTRVIVSSGTAAMNAPVGTTLPWSYLGLEAGSVTLAADVDWRGLPSLAIPEGTTISLGGNNLYLNGTVTGRGTFTAAAATGGELHFDVADGATFVNERLTYHAAGSFALTGTLKLVKDGAGMFKAERTGQTYSGGTDVLTGTLKFGNQPYAGIFGARTGDVTVSKNGTLDMNGWISSYEYQFILNGGIIQNAGADRDVAYSQFANIRLGADSTILPTSSMGVVGNGYAATTLDLGGHTLTIPIANGKALYLANTEIKNGLVDVTSGGWLYSGKYTPSGTSNNDIIATNADFRINAGMRLYAKIKARSYEAIYAYDYNDCAAVIEVNGTFKPSAHDYFRGCTMMDGSTIDLSSRTNALPIVSAFTSGANTLGFEAGKTVHVKFGGYHASGSEPVISWAAKPVDIDTVKFRSAPGEMARGFITKDDGLYITCGFMILVR